MIAIKRLTLLGIIFFVLNDISAQSTKYNQNELKNFIQKSSSMILFEKNTGQFPSEVLFSFRTSFGFMAVYSDKLRLFAMQRKKIRETERGENRDTTLWDGVHSVDIRFPGSSRNWDIVPSMQSDVKGNYVIGKENSVSPDMFGELLLHNVYPGIDLRLYSVGRNLEFDWVVQKAEDYRLIRMNFQGQKDIQVEKNGSILIGLKHQDINLIIPSSYQIIEGKKRVVGVEVVKEKDNTIRYELSGKADMLKPLVIDPAFTWSTVFDLNDYNFAEYCFAICASDSGIYVSGLSFLLPSQAYMSNVPAGYSSSILHTAIIYKFNLLGTKILAWSMCNSGVSTNSTRVFPTDSDVFKDGRICIVYSNGDMEIFNSSLTSESFYPALFGNITASLTATVTDGDSVIYIAGLVRERVSGIPIGPDTTFSSSVLCRYNINNMTVTPEWGTYLSGSRDLVSLALTPDKSKIVFATVGDSAKNLTLPVDSIKGQSEIIVGVLNNQTGMPSSFSMLTYYGGSGNERYPFITATDSFIYVICQTASTDIPATSGSFQSNNNAAIGLTPVAIGRIPLNGNNAPGFKSSYFGTSGLPAGIAFNKRNAEIAILGTTLTGISAQNTNPPSPVFASQSGGNVDLFIATAKADLSQLLFSSYLGGAREDYFGQTGTPVGQGTFMYYDSTGLMYAATSTHSDVTGPSGFPAYFFDSIPGFDKTRDHPTWDCHLLFAFNTSTYDYGDAPLSYENNSPAFNVADQSSIHIGNYVDAERSSVSGAIANGDDLLNSGYPDDEDGLTIVPKFNISAGVYSLSVPVTNRTGNTVKLWGWIDFDKNGKFDPAESSSVDVQNNNTEQVVSLSWTGITATPGSSYLRLRISTDNLNANSANGPGNKGEVEDYPIDFCIGGYKSLTQVSCGSYILNGITYTSSGIYTQNIPSNVGCDSTIVLNLVINEISASQLNISACGSYTLNGTVFTNSGTYIQHLTNHAGCDSTITLNLTLGNSVLVPLQVSTCGKYFFNGVTYTSSGLYTIHFTTSYGCDSVINLDLTIKQVPQLDLGDNISFCEWEPLILTADNYDSYLWQDGSTNSSYLVTSPGLYSLQVGLNGCYSKDSILVTARTSGCPCEVVPMSAFTPNGDGFNDTWGIKSDYNCIKNIIATVYNRYGSKVFESKNYNNTWDGTYNGKPLPDGTYYYIIDVRLLNGQGRYLKGDVTILR